MKKAVLAVTLAAAVAAGSGNMPVWNGKAQEITSETYMPVSASKDKKKTEEKKTKTVNSLFWSRQRSCMPSIIMTRLSNF